MDKRQRVILWYVKEVNIFLRENPLDSRVGEYSQEVWRDLLDRVL